MKKVLSIIIILLIYSCKTKNTSESSNDNLFNTESVPNSNNPNTQLEAEHLSPKQIIHPNGAKEITRFKDTTINNIIFGDCDTVKALFGNQYDLLPDNQDLPSIQVFNNKGDQLLTMFMIYGSVNCDFQQYLVEYSASLDTFYKKPFLLNVEQFKTGRGVYLGQALEQLQSNLGGPTEVKKENGLTILIYEEYDNLYFANYYFLNNKLIKFRYGFEYP
ncbi:MAG: hypothetical protein IPL12_05025 [Bacteroidetes bacterium]|nr:hypothetical protein [Bacteroidota bacterium]